MSPFPPHELKCRLKIYLDMLIDQPDTKDPERDWSEEEAADVERFRQTELPERFQLNPWTFCDDGRRLKRNLLMIMRAGPSSGNARAALEKARELIRRFQTAEAA